MVSYIYMSYWNITIGVLRLLKLTTLYFLNCKIKLFFIFLHAIFNMGYYYFFADQLF